MATYLSGSNIQSDPMQTLHLMNPGYNGFTDASNAGNLVLVNPSAGIGQNNSAGNNSQEHQQYIGFPLPPVLTQSSLVQQPTLATMYNSSIGQQSPSSLFTNRVGNNPYSWSTVNELSFLPSNDVTQITQSLAARLTSPNSGQQSNSDISQFNIRRHSVHEEQTSVLDNGVALGLDMDNSHGAAGPSQGLSLSLSPQQHPVQLQYYNMQPNESSIRSCARLAHVNAEDNDTRGERIPNKWIGNLSQFRASSRDGLLGTGFQNPMNDISSRQRHPDANVLTVVGFGGLLSGSKYLKPAQELLDEVVSVRRGIKSSLSKHVKLPESWMASSSLLDGPFARDRSVTENLSTAREGIPCTTSLPTVASVSVQLSSNVSELTQQEKQELQMKKARLMAMLDEVDRRYKQYYGQMQMVVDSFESAAGLGAAKMYTALALQTISRHFRCLRDAISSQIRLASTALNEENPSSPALGRGETSRLRYVDQHFRQQRALQQLGMMQQHAWRPQRGLPERSVSVLRAWLFEHFLHPYPKDADKIMLARQTGLTRNQVSNWFINARVRLWKPMVEEMYLEEKKESAIDGTPSTDRKSGADNFLANQGDGGNTDTSDQGSKQARSDQAGSSDDGENQMMPDRRRAASDMLQQSAARNASSLNIAADSATLGGHLVQEIQGVLKKPRNGIALHDSATLLSEVEVQELKAKERNEEAFEHENKQSFKMIGMEQGYGAYHTGGADRYVQEGFASVSRYPSPHVAAGGHGVSLTLGLQHCDGLSLSGAPQQQHSYLYQQQSHGGGLVPQLSTAAAAATRRLDPNAGSTASQDYYSSVNDDSPTSYEALSQLHNRKRFAHQLLQHDFVA